jgi:hypothetical protein
MPTTSPLDARIRSAVTELIEAAPQPPALPELEAGRLPRRAPRRRWDPPSRRHRAPLLLAGAAVLALAVVAALALAPSSVERPPEVAATELHALALVAARQDVPALTSGQYLETRQQVTFSASVGDIGGALTPGATATATATIDEWANDEGGSCIQATAQPATFASPANQTAWTAAGLLIDPSPATTTSCADAGTGVFDVSHLSTDPHLLANELEDGTTGIASLDQQQSGPAAGFERAVQLMIGPTVGTTAALDAALYDALADMGGVTLLGQAQTSTGAIGVGFSVPSAGSQPSVAVIDPATGALLEARNVPDPEAYDGFGRSYLPASFNQSIGYDITISVFDPLGSPAIAPLPAGLTPPLPPGSSGTIVATTKPGVTAQQVYAFDDQALQPFGKAGVALAPGSNGTFQFTFLFTGSASQVQQYDQALHTSGLFSSVVLGPPVT